MRHVLADTVVNQLIACGSEPNQLIDFAAEVIRSVTEHGFADSTAKEAGEGVTDTAVLKSIPMKVVPVSKHYKILKGERISLQPVTEQDIPFLEAWCEDPEIRKTFSLRLLSDIVVNYRSRLGKEARYDFVLFDETMNRVGLVSLFNIDKQVSQAETAKLLGEPAARGKGYASQASKMLLAYAFDVLKLSRVYLRTEGLNLHNIKINEKLGYRFEGILRHADKVDDQLVNVVVMSMLAAEYQKLYRVKTL